MTEGSEGGKWELWVRIGIVASVALGGLSGTNVLLGQDDRQKIAELARDHRAMDRETELLSARLARAEAQLSGRGGWMMCQTRWNDEMMRQAGVPRSQFPCVPDLEE